MSKPAIEGKEVSRISAYLLPPEMLTMVTQKDHHLYDERIHLPVDPGLVKSFMAVGSKVPLIVVKDGNQLLIVEGRQRYKAALAANKQLEKEGKELIKVKVQLESGASESDLFGLSILTNELRYADGPMAKAAKAKRFIDMGRTEEEAAVVFGVTKATIKNWLAINCLSATARKAVDTGKISVTAAAKLCELPPEKQADALKKMVETPGKATVKKAKETVNAASGKKTIKKRSALDADFVSQDVQAKLRDACRYLMASLETPLNELETLCVRNILADPDVQAFNTF